MAERSAVTQVDPDGPKHRAMRSDRWMTDVETFMWTVEKDPRLDPTIGNVTILDRPPDPERLGRRLTRMVEQVPRLRQRVSPPLGPLVPPSWRDDPDFDLAHHVRRVVLEGPGTERELLDLATLFVEQPLDRTRPLWEFVVIEGLEGGRAALVQKVHHAITDGRGAVRMSEQFIDVSRDAPDGPVVEITPGSPVSPSRIGGTAAEAAAHTWHRGYGAARRLVAGTTAAVTRPRCLVTLPAEVVRTTTSALRQVTVTDRRRSPLWTERSLRRRLEVLRVPFEEAHHAATALGGSLNDLFVAGVAAGVGTHHRRAGVPVDVLRMAMPVSTRHDDLAAGNAFVPVRVLVPVNIEDPVSHFRAVSAVLDRARHERAIGIVDAVAGLANLLPPPVLAHLARTQAGAVDFSASNVRGAPFDLYIAGALVEATFPMGPLTNTAFNITMMSYSGSLDMGLHVDTGAISDPGLLRDDIAAAFETLTKATG